MTDTKKSKALSVLISTVKSKMFGTTRTLAGYGHPSKVDERQRRKLVREATKRAMAGIYGKE